MTSRSRSRSPRRESSESPVELWARLKQFADVWVDGNGHSLLEPSAVMRDARKFIPELVGAIAALERTDHGCSGCDGVSGIDSLELHGVIHSALKEELRSNVLLVGSSIELGDWTCIGRGFRARQIQGLLATCFDTLNAWRLR